MVVHVRAWAAVALSVLGVATFGWLSWEATTDAAVLWATGSARPGLDRVGRDPLAAVARIERVRAHVPVDDRLERAVARLELVAARMGGDRAARVRARQALERASRLSPLDARLDHALGWAYLEAGDLERAEDRFRQAAAKDPAEPEHVYARGRVHELAGRYDEAAAAYRTALTLASSASGSSAKASARLELMMSERTVPSP